MRTLLIIMVIFAVSLQDVSRKAYNTRHKDGIFTITAISALTAMLFFAARSIGNFEFSYSIILYSVAFAVLYVLASAFAMLAIDTGVPLMLTSLVVSYSLTIPIAYGFLVFSEEIDTYAIIGIILLLISLVLVNIEGKSEKKQITFRWVIFALITFLSNGFLTVIIKVFQTDFNGKYENEFMMLGLLMVSIILFIIAAIKEKKNFFQTVRNALPFGALCGIGNGTVNSSNLILLLVMPVTVLFPITSAGGIVLTSIISLTIYREKLSPHQVVGLILGIGSIVFLNI